MSHVIVSLLGHEFRAPEAEAAELTRKIAELELAAARAKVISEENKALRTRVGRFETLLTRLRLDLDLGDLAGDLEQAVEAGQKRLLATELERLPFTRNAHAHLLEVGSLANHLERLVTAFRADIAANFGSSPDALRQAWAQMRVEDPTPDLEGKDQKDLRTARNVAFARELAAASIAGGAQ